VASAQSRRRVGNHSPQLLDLSPNRGLLSLRGEALGFPLSSLSSRSEDRLLEINQSMQEFGLSYRLCRTKRASSSAPHRVRNKIRTSVNCGVGSQRQQTWVAVHDSSEHRSVLTTYHRGVGVFVLFHSQSCTLHVIVVDNRGISIAAGSRHVIRDGKTVKTLDAFEKVIPLGTRLAFMSSGLTEISIASSEIRPAQIARRCYADLFKGDHRTSIKDLCTSYAKLTNEQLNRLTDPEKTTVESLMQQLGALNNQMMESVIADVDSDGSLRVETIDFYLSRPSPAHADVFRFDSNLSEAIANEAPRMILSGEINILKRAFENASTTIGQPPSFEAWVEAMRDGRLINTAESDETLLSLAIKYSPPAQTQLGHPIWCTRSTRETVSRKSGSLLVSKPSIYRASGVRLAVLG